MLRLSRTWPAKVPERLSPARLPSSAEGNARSSRLQGVSGSVTSNRIADPSRVRVNSPAADSSTEADRTRASSTRKLVRRGSTLPRARTSIAMSRIGADAYVFAIATPLPGT